MVPGELRGLLNPDRDIPLYLQLKEALLQGLRQGAWSGTKPLPSERELTVELGVSRATVRQAIQELEGQGWLVRKQGRGTFSNPKKIEQRLELLTGFSENMRAAGFEASSEVLSVGLESASEQVAPALGIVTGSPVAVIRRRRFVNGEPLLVEICHLNGALVPGLVERDLTGSLYETLVQVYRLVLAKGVETVEAIPADAEIAKLLDVPGGAPTIYTERTVQTDRGIAVEFTRRYARGDKSRFSVILSGGNGQLTRKEG